MADKEKSQSLPSAVQLFNKSYSLVRENLNVYALVYFVPAALAVANLIAVINESSKRDWDFGNVFGASVLGPGWNANNTSYPVAGIFLFFLLLFGSIIATFLANILNLRVAQGKKPKFGDVWSELWREWLWLKMLGLMIVLAVILIVGFILLIIPGVILLWRTFLAPYILVDKKTTIDEALSQSWKMTKGYGWPIYSVILLSILLALTNAIPLIGGLIAFALVVVYAVAPALRYQELKHRS